MKILITGATGFVGRSLMETFPQHGFTPVGLVRNLGRARESLPNSALYEWDFKTILPDSVWAGAEAIIHLAGESVAHGRWTKARREALTVSRIQPLEALRNSLEGKKHSIKALISASGVGYFGDTGNRYVSDMDSPGTDFLSDLAQKWEAVVNSFSDPRYGGLRTVSLRFGVILALDGGALKPLQRAMKWSLGLGQILGSGKQGFPWIHRDDVLELIAFALNSDALSGGVNAAVPNHGNQSDFARHLALSQGAPFLTPIPGFLFKLMLGDFADVLLGGQNILPKKLMAAGFRFKHPDLQSAIPLGR